MAKKDFGLKRQSLDRKKLYLIANRDKPLCSIMWILCRDCPDLIDNHCKWVSTV